MGVTIEVGVSTGRLAQKGRWRDLTQVLKWLLIGLTYLDPMALTAYQLAVAQAGADEQPGRRSAPANAEVI